MQLHIELVLLNNVLIEKEQYITFSATLLGLLSPFGNCTQYEGFKKNLKVTLGMS
jgi:hypothetical protein